MKSNLKKYDITNKYTFTLETQRLMHQRNRNLSSYFRAQFGFCSIHALHIFMNVRYGAFAFLC